VVNLILKNFWGRARPNDILQFGGNENFTPWFKISDTCSSNCSFVSGDASVGFALIGLFFLTKNKNFYWLALFSGFFLGIIRILEGAHFLSDIIIAGFLIFILTYVQSLIYKKKFNDDL
jgi:lipid A 4'-phosphatase